MKSVELRSSGSKLTSEHVALQVLRVEVGLGAVGARELSIGILLRNGVAFGRTVEAILHDGWSSWRTW